MKKMNKKLKKLVSVLLMVSMLAGMAMVSGAAPATEKDITDNLLKASNFYEGQTAWTVAPNGKIDNKTVSEEYVWAEIPDMGMTRALKITQKAGDENNESARVYQFVNLEKYQTYKLSFWLKIEGTGSVLSVKYMTDKSTMTLQEGGATTNNDWRKFEYEFNAEYDSNHPQIRFEMTDANGNTDVVFYLTDVCLKKTVKNYVPSIPDILDSTMRWSGVKNGTEDSYSLSNDEIVMTTKYNKDVTNSTCVQFKNEIVAGKTYQMSFSVQTTIEEVVEGSESLKLTVWELYPNYSEKRSCYYEIDCQEEDCRLTWEVGEYQADKTPTIRMAVSRPSNEGSTVTYTITNFSIIEVTEEDEVADTARELVAEDNKSTTVTTEGPSEPENLCLAGDFALKDGVLGQNFNMSNSSSNSFANGNWTWGSGEDAVKKWATWSVIDDSSVNTGMAFKVSGTGSGNSWLNHTIAWDTNKTYDISFKMKTGDTKLTGFYMGASSYTGSETARPVSPTINQQNTEWTEYTCAEFKPKDTNGTLRFMVQLGEGQELYLADVRIVEHDATSTPAEPGEVSVTHTGAVNTEYTISFDVSVTGDATIDTTWNDSAYFDTSHNIVLCQSGFEGDEILAKYNATSEKTSVTHTYIPTERNDATEKNFTLYLAPTTGGELEYTISNLSVTYRTGTVIQSIEFAAMDIFDANPGVVSDDVWGSVENDVPYTAVQRWEYVQKGLFATSDTGINTSLDTGAFTEFISGTDYRYSIAVSAKDGYYLSENLSLTVAGSETEAKIYFDAEGNAIICPEDGALFFTTMGDANKDGSTNVQDLVRVKKYKADFSVEVYLKKCKFDTTTNVFTDSDVSGLRAYLTRN